MILNKFLHPGDYQELKPEIELIDDVLSRMVWYNLDCPDRKWEYAMALRAMRQVASGHPSILDIGSNISPFPLILHEAGFYVECMDLEDHSASHRDWWFKPNWYLELPDDQYDFVTAIGVIEHVKDDRATLRRWWERARTGMFLTHDGSEDGRVLVPHVHYRTYTVEQMLSILAGLPEAMVAGDVDITFHGYNVASASGFGAFGSAFVMHREEDREEVPKRRRRK